MGKYSTSIVFKVNAEDAISSKIVSENLIDLISAGKVVLSPIKDLLTKGYKYKDISSHIEFDDNLIVFQEDIEQNVGDMITDNARAITEKQSESSFSDVYANFWIRNMVKQIHNREDISESLGALEEFNEVMQQLHELNPTASEKAESTAKGI